MGSNTSKQSNDSAFSKKNVLETASNADPRSPTPEIIRTPLQCKTDSKHNITKNADLRKTFENAADEEKLIHNNPILSAVIKNHLQSYDPRSPTQDFERTPIVLTKVDDLEDDRKLLYGSILGSPSLENDTFNEIDNSCDSCAEADESPKKLPKNLCNGFMDMTLNLNGSVKEVDEPLGSSTASNEAIESNLSPKDPVVQITELLETNFDYEDNFDSHSQEIIPNGDSKTSFSKIPRFKVLTDDPRSPSTGIERTPIVVAKSSADDSASNVEEMSDDTLIKVLQNTNTELRYAGNKPSDSPEGLLIYEDNVVPMNDTPKKSKCDPNISSRTPLSCMKNKTSTAHARSKSANEQNSKKQHALTSKSARRASHIPRLKSLTKPMKPMMSGSTVSLKNLSKVNLNGDCENTPPHSHRDKWDTDSSIVL